MEDKERKIAEQIVGSIDDDGYLRRDTAAIVDDLAFRQNIDSNEEEVEKLIKLVQQFDPPGVAARDLQECLLLQLNRLKVQGKGVEKAIEAIENYFDEFTKKHYEKIQRGLGIDDDGLKDVINQIIKLNPKPGGNHAADALTRRGASGIDTAKSPSGPAGGDILFSAIPARRPPHGSGGEGALR